MRSGARPGSGFSSMNMADVPSDQSDSGHPWARRTAQGPELLGFTTREEEWPRRAGHPLQPPRLRQPRTSCGATLLNGHL